MAALDPRDAWPTWVLSNHDNPRHRSRYDRAGAVLGDDPDTTARRSEARARAAAVLLLTLRGTPFLYQGEELGLLDGVIPPERRVDPGGRDGCRSPVPWDGSPDHGWPTVGGAEVWLPFPPESGQRNRLAQQGDPSSILHLYRRLIDLRHDGRALSLGSQTMLDLAAGVLGYERRSGDESFVMAINLTGESVELTGADAAVLAGRTVVVASDGADEGRSFPGWLGGDQAVVLASAPGPRAA